VPNRLLQGDNLEAMAALLPELRGRIDLIYVDPPFGSNADYVIHTAAGTRAAYGDRWAGGLSGYLEMLLPRLRLMRELLSPRGSFYIHLDATAVHYVKVLLDELYGVECFQREIIWRIGWISGYKSAVRNWARNHDTILFYTRDPSDFTFHKAYVPHLPGYRRRGGKEGPGHPIEDVWNGSPAEHALSGEESLDSIQIKSFSSEKTGYETQKNESLLRRIVQASSDPGDLVADFFCGSGTTLVAAERLGRRWLGCDQNPAAVDITRERLAALPRHEAFDVVVLPGPGAAKDTAAGPT
jgi:site-specific DNA-methyltransferase (adenine-specific)/adenine-specific DNA-methyltransferase